MIKNLFFRGFKLLRRVARWIGQNSACRAKASTMFKFRTWFRVTPVNNKHQNLENALDWYLFARMQFRSASPFFNPLNSIVENFAKAEEGDEAWKFGRHTDRTRGRFSTIRSHCNVPGNASETTEQLYIRRLEVHKCLQLPKIPLHEYWMQMATCVIWLLGGRAWENVLVLCDTSTSGVGKFVRVDVGLCSFFTLRREWKVAIPLITN